MTASSTKPYLIRAIYDWCADNGYTPHLAVVVDEHVRVPPGYARDGQIVLNVGTEATANLELGNEAICFQARFGGVSHHLYIPVTHVLAVYARENGQGMAFEVALSSLPSHPTLAAVDAEHDAGAELVDGDEGPDDEPPRTRGGHLKVVK